MIIEEMLDQLAEFQAQIDYLELRKRELLDAVKVPDEVLAVQRAANERKRAADSEYQKREIELSRIERDQLSTVDIPPEIRAAVEAVERKRMEIMAETSRQKAEAWGDACRKKEQIDRELTDGVAEVYAQIEQRKQEINVEFEGKADAAKENIDKLTAMIKDATIKAGASRKGKFFQAVFTKGRVTWATEVLDSVYFALNKIIETLAVFDDPQADITDVPAISDVRREISGVISSLTKARKEGAPSVSIRKI